jgi:hypothetical protein
MINLITLHYLFFEWAFDATEIRRVKQDLVSFAAALYVEVSPHERLLTRAQHSIPFIRSDLAT